METSLNNISEKQMQEFLEIKNIDQLNQFCEKLKNSRFKLKLILIIDQLNDKNKLISILKNHYEISSQGEFLKLLSIDREDNNRLIFIGYFWCYPWDSVSILFTFLPIDELEKRFFHPFLFNQTELSILWITYKLTIALIENIVKKYYAEITSYSGKYIPSTHRKSRLRPYIERKIIYRAKDTKEAIEELKNIYGINVEKFTAFLPDIGYLDFDRKTATFSLKGGNLNPIMTLIEWVISESRNYLNKIEKFKQKIHESIYVERKYFLSNNLALKFEENLDFELCQKIIEEFKKDFRILEQDLVELEKDFVFRLKLFNKNKKGFYRVVLTPSFIHIFLVFKANYIGILPLLDILDYHQPNYSIQILES